MRVDRHGNLCDSDDPSIRSLSGLDSSAPHHSSPWKRRCSRCVAVVGCGLSPWWWLLVGLFMGAVVSSCFVEESYIGVSRFLLFALVLTGWLISLALHEYAHAVVAYRGGDVSIIDSGYLSLDVTKYISPISTFLIPCLLLVFGGIPLPGGAVMIMTSRLYSKHWMTLVSLAGPLMTLVCGVVAVGGVHLVRAVDAKGSVYQGPLGQGLSLIVFFQFAAFLFNIIPLPPLDGWGALSPWLSSDCFLKRWMDHPYYGMCVSLLSVLLLYILMRVTKFTYYIVRFLQLFMGLDPFLLMRGMNSFRNPMQ